MYIHVHVLYMKICSLYIHIFEIWITIWRLSNSSICTPSCKESHTKHTHTHTHSHKHIAGSLSANRGSKDNMQLFSETSFSWADYGESLGCPPSFVSFRVWQFLTFLSAIFFLHNCFLSFFSLGWLWRKSQVTFLIRNCFCLADFLFHFFFDIFFFNAFFFWNTIIFWVLFFLGWLWRKCRVPSLICKFSVLTVFSFWFCFFFAQLFFESFFSWADYGKSLRWPPSFVSVSFFGRFFLLCDFFERAFWSYTIIFWVLFSLGLLWRKSRVPSLIGKWFFATTIFFIRDFLLMAKVLGDLPYLKAAFYVIWSCCLYRCIFN